MIGFAERPAPSLTSRRTRERVSGLLARFGADPATDAEMAAAAAAFRPRRRYQPPLNETAAFILGLRAGYRHSMNPLPDRGC